MSMDFMSWVCSSLEIIAQIDAKNLRESHVRNLINDIKQNHSTEQNCRVVCAVLQPVAQDGTRLKGAIKTLRYWASYEQE